MITTVGGSGHVGGTYLFRRNSQAVAEKKHKHFCPETVQKQTKPHSGEFLSKYAIHERLSSYPSSI